jgi:hypothetical protein
MDVATFKWTEAHSGSWDDRASEVHERFARRLGGSPGG